MTFSDTLAVISFLPSFYLPPLTRMALLPISLVLSPVPCYSTLSIVTSFPCPSHVPLLYIPGFCSSSRIYVHFWRAVVQGLSWERTYVCLSGCRLPKSIWNVLVPCICLQSLWFYFKKLLKQYILLPSVASIEAEGNFLLLKPSYASDSGRPLCWDVFKAYSCSDTIKLHSQRGKGK